MSQPESKRTPAQCFIIQPFGNKVIPGTDVSHDHDEVFNALAKLRNIDPNFPIETFRADIEEVGRENLATHVQSCIDKADFCIADITGHNPNVLYEIGFARGRELKVIVICKEGTEIPTDLKGVVYVTYTNKDLSTVASRIKKHFKRISGIAKKKTLLPKVEYLARRDDNFIREKIRGSRHSIDILQTNLAILQRDFLDDISHALESHDDLTVRILTLDPQSIFVNYRAKQLEDTDVKVFRGELQNALESTYLKLRRFGRRSSIRVYDNFPTQIAFFLDNEILSCVVSAMGRSRDNCAFVVPTNMSNAKHSFAEHFDRLWSTQQKSQAYQEIGLDQ